MSKKLFLSRETKAWLYDISDRPRVNIYTCDKCGGAVVTKDIHPGVTPFLIACRLEGCNGVMSSGFYRCPQDLPHQFEFYRPETVDDLDIPTVDHLKRGGLILRPIQAPDKPVTKT